jgi:hypothetical protein
MTRTAPDVPVLLIVSCPAEFVYLGEYPYKIRPVTTVMALITNSITTSIAFGTLRIENSPL